MRIHVLPAITISVLALAATTAAQAADLPSRRMAPVYVPPPIPVFTWTGFFVGANAGADFGDTRTTSYYLPAGSISGSTGSAGLLSTNGTQNGSGFTGGGQIGYNYELGGAGLGGFGFGGGGLVVGVVADAQYLNQASNGAIGTNYTFSGAPGNAFVAVPGLARTNVVGTQDHTNFFGTVRGRLGFAFDRALFYGTGGFAYDTHTTGYTYGGGIEFALTNNISVGAEYLRVNLDRSLNTTATYVAPAGLGAGTLFLNTTGGRDQFNVARAFVNYKFTYPVAAPVVARATDPSSQSESKGRGASRALFLWQRGRVASKQARSYPITAISADATAAARAKARPIIIRHGPVGAAAAASAGIVAMVPAMRRSSVCVARSTSSAGVSGASP